MAGFAGSVLIKLVDNRKNVGGLGWFFTGESD